MTSKKVGLHFLLFATKYHSKAARKAEPKVSIFLSSSNPLLSSGLNTTAEELMNSIERNEEEVSPSTLFAVASILEGCTYINGSPQNTFVPGKS